MNTATKRNIEYKVLGCTLDRDNVAALFHDLRDRCKSEDVYEKWLMHLFDGTKNILDWTKAAAPPPETTKEIEEDYEGLERVAKKTGISVEDVESLCLTEGARERANEAMAEDPYRQAGIEMIPDIVQLMVNKGMTYGNSWIRRGEIGAFMMLARKWDRIENMVKKACSGFDLDEEKLPKSTESIEETIRDLLVYLLLWAGYRKVINPKEYEEWKTRENL